MLPFEYSVILETLKKLKIDQIKVFFEASPISNQSLVGEVHRVKYYYNKRFYKQT
jgi:hypothetical protein